MSKKFSFVLGAVTAFCFVYKVLTKKNNCIVEKVETTKPKPVADLIIVEQQPQYPSNIMEWVVKNLQYPASAKEQGIQGRVVVHFMINSDGHVSDTRVVESVDYLLDQEALRVVDAIPSDFIGLLPDNSYLVPINFVIK